MAGDAETGKKEAGELFASGHNVRMLLVEQAVDIAREIYLSMTVDPVSGTALLMGCAEGGVDIESLPPRSRKRSSACMWTWPRGSAVIM